ncbi:DUF1302 domain-containing protein [Catenovulum sp. 2E275]|uniref:DUF1302 domain-containing protein n=1 Tax=Catenovulum sp. 2E275 TaxID=2980497 RepID=UPI0021D0D3A5|nr:DUF1302 domain-containing protein [Catenovulum sp. 2E275]MCU4677577.1 DUF1302 domain-containing protein [Catenovulum sp. 2E275]
MNRPEALGFCKSAIAASLLSSLSVSALASQFEVAGLDISFDSTFTVGTSYRVENRDWSLIGKNNQPNVNWQNKQGPYNAVLNPVYTPSDVWSQPGSYSANGDLANLNHDPGKAFSRMISGSHELDINAGDWGFFSRFMYFYDQAASQHKEWKHPLTGEYYDLCADKKAKERICQDFRFLDAFIYGHFDIGDMPVSVKLGDQVVSWGESTLIAHGINEINPVDIARLKAPGAELKEAFIPVGMLWASIGLTDNVSLDAFYQYEWEETILPAAGSYFSTNDFAGYGGYYNNVQIGFTQHPDINTEYLVNQMNTFAKGYLSNNIDDINTLVAQMGAATPEQQQALAQQFYQITAPYYLFGTKTAIRARESNGDIKPSDGGQYGLKLGIYAPDLNDTEFGLYYMNYHSRRPVISGRASNFEVASIYQDIQYLLANNITDKNFQDLKIFTQAYLEYPEDIQLYGFSFNTSLNETAIAGELTYRQDEPLQIDDVELLYAGMPEQLANAGLRPELAGISQMDYVPSGGTAKGYILRDTIQAQATVTHLFGPTFGADSLALLAEAGIVQIQDMPEYDELRLNGPGTARGGVLPVNQGLISAISNGIETTPFPTETSWGYRVLARLDYNNLFYGINVQPKIVFSHDVKGITPDPMFLFVEDRQSAALSVNFDYQKTLGLELSYNAFWGGVGQSNGFSDRDYVSLSIKYSL